MQPRFTIISAFFLICACSYGPEVEACRDWVEYQIDTPSSITNFQATTEKSEAGTLYLQYRAEECSAVGWPDKTCDVLTSMSWNSGRAMSSSEEAKEKARQVDKQRRAKAYGSLSEDQRAATRVEVAFDAANTSNAPIRYEAYCVVKHSKESGQPVILDADFTRGF